MQIWRRLLIERRIVLALAAAAIIAHVLWAYGSRNGADLARCGALWSVLAGVLIARPIIRLGYANWYQKSRSIDGGSFEETLEEAEAERQAGIDALNVQVYGPALLIAGTLLWGYGDLLSQWLFPAMHK
jgi:hypothetical protein